MCPSRHHHPTFSPYSLSSSWLIRFIMLGFFCCAHSGCLFYIAKKPSALFNLPAIPASQRQETTELESWPDVDTVILEDEATIRFEKNDQDTSQDHSTLRAVVDHRRKFKIMHEAGLEEALLRWQVDDNSHLEDVIARSIQSNGAVAYAYSPSLQSQPWDRQSADPKANKAIWQLQLKVPDAKVGSIIEYRYRKIYKNADLLPIWLLAASQPIARAQLIVEAPASIKISHRYNHGFQPSKESPFQEKLEDGTQRLIFTQYKIPAYYQESMMPSLSHVAYWVALQASLIEPSEKRSKQLAYLTWQEAVRPIDAAIRSYRFTTPPMSSSLGSTASSSLNEDISQLRQQICPLTNVALGSKFTEDLAQIAKGEPSSSLDAAAYLVQALKHRGIEAYVALLASEDGVPILPDFPGLYAFSQAVVALPYQPMFSTMVACSEESTSISKHPLKQKKNTGNSQLIGASVTLEHPLCHQGASDWFLIYPQHPYCSLGAQPLGTYAKQVLVLKNKPFATDKNAATEILWIKPHASSAKQAILRHQSQWQIKLDGTLYGQINQDLHGALLANLLEKINPLNKPLNCPTPIEPDKYVAALAQEAQRFGGYAQGNNWQILNQDSSKDDLQITSQMDLLAQRLNNQDYVVPTVDLFGSSIPENWLTTRQLPYYLDGPRILEITSTIKIPASFRVNYPDNIQLKYQNFSYQSFWQQQKHTLIYRRYFEIGQMLLSPRNWEDFQDFAKKIAEAEKSVLTFYEKRRQTSLHRP